VILHPIETEPLTDPPRNPDRDGIANKLPSQISLTIG
jgi:hypothetical protein